MDRHTHPRRAYLALAEDMRIKMKLMKLFQDGLFRTVAEGKAVMEDIPQNQNFLPELIENAHHRNVRPRNRPSMRRSRQAK